MKKGSEERERGVDVKRDRKREGERGRKREREIKRQGATRCKKGLLKRYTEATFLQSLFLILSPLRELSNTAAPLVLPPSLRRCE